MTMPTIKIEVISPEKVVLRHDQVSMITLPAIDGTIGILPNHTALFTKIVEGEVKITLTNEEILLAVGGGFAEIKNNKVLILVTRAVHADELNENEAQTAKQRALELLQQKPKGEQLLQAQSLYKQALIDLSIIRKKHRIKSGN